MAVRERYQNPVLGDTINLRFFVYNSNNRANIFSINKVEIFWLDENAKTESNPDGRTLIQTFDGSAVQNVEEGQYLLQVDAEEIINVSGEEAGYRIGNYVDVWYVVFEDGEEVSIGGEKSFTIYPDLWYTSDLPCIYDFSFTFSPNKIVKGNKKYLNICIESNAPNSTQLEQYYENLAVLANIEISIRVHPESPNYDATYPSRNVIVSDVAVSYREREHGYYLLDTTNMETGLYQVWFEMDFGENHFVSEKLNIEFR